MDITFLQEIIQFILNLIPAPYAAILLLLLGIGGYFLRKRIKSGKVKLKSGAIRIKGIDRPLFGILEFEKQDDEFVLTISLENSDGEDFITLTFDDRSLPIKNNVLVLKEEDFGKLNKTGKKIMLGKSNEVPAQYTAYTIVE